MEKERPWVSESSFYRRFK